MAPRISLPPQERVRLGKMQHPVRGLLHGSAALVFSIAAAVLVVIAPGGWSRKAALGVFGASLVTLYTVSSLYHSIPWSARWKARMQRLDHSMIYVLTAGTYTPLALIVLDGWLQGVTLGLQWSIVVVGIGQKLLVPRLGGGFSIALQTAQGWMALALLWPLLERLPLTAVGLIVLGGVLYTVGMVIMVTRWPQLWPRSFSYHEVFHVLVVAGSTVHFLVVARYVAPYPL